MEVPEVSVVRDAPPPQERFRWMFRFAIRGDLRFISHHDTLRMFQRAMARAAVPVRFSQGFNPHQRLSLPLPRPVGISSEAEVLVIETDVALEGENFLRRLREQCPEGCEILSVQRLSPGEDPKPETVRYVLPVDAAAPPPDVTERISTLMQSEHLWVTRDKGPKTESRSVDVRPYLLEIQATEHGVEFLLKVTGSGTAKASEIARLLGFDADAVQHHLLRKEVEWRLREQPQSA